jgi:hypothetical protein
VAQVPAYTETLEERMSEKELWKYALLAVIAVGLFAHVLYPRYDWRPVEGGSAVSIVIYDRWTGRFQRAVYSDNGSLNVMGVYTPF